MLSDSEAERLERLLSPFYGIIREAILEGFRYRLREYREELSNHTARTRASLTNDLIVTQFLKKKLQQFGIRVFRLQNRILFDIQGKAILHFKKLDRFLLSSNLQTEFALKFTGQLSLPGIPLQLPRLVAGYIPNGDWTSIEEVHVTYPKGNKVQWSRSLLEQPEILAKTDEITNDDAQRKERPKRRVWKKGSKSSKPEEGTGSTAG